MCKVLKHAKNCRIWGISHTRADIKKILSNVDFANDNLDRILSFIEDNKDIVDDHDHEKDDNENVEDNEDNEDTVYDEDHKIMMMIIMMITIMSWMKIIKIMLMIIIIKKMITMMFMMKIMLLNLISMNPSSSCKNASGLLNKPTTLPNSNPREKKIGWRRLITQLKTLLKF